MEFVFLRNILNDLRLRFDSKLSTSDCCLRRELLALGDIEKRLLKKKVIGFVYNVGALRTLKLLSDCNILGVNDFLLNVEREEEVQAIIADILENDETQLADVIKASVTSNLISCQFEICFRQYCLDCIDRPELIRKEFIGSLEDQLPREIYVNSIVRNLIDVLLTHEELRENEVTEVIGRQKEWNSQFTGPNYVLIMRILQNISVNHSELIMKHVIDNLKTNYKLNWFFLLSIVKSVKQKAEVHSEFKAFLNNLFQKFIETKDVNHLIAMMILARQVYHFDVDSPITFKTWLKNTIGAMHYNMKSQEKFTQTLDALQSIIFLETDLDILNIHAQTAISAPHGLNHTVLEYKQLLRIKIASFSEPETVMDLT